jgi:hypothetical protein
MSLQGTLSGQGNTGPSLTIAEVRVDYHRAAFSIGNVRPRLSWIVTTDINNWIRAGYEVELYGQDGVLRSKAGWIESRESAGRKCRRISSTKEGWSSAFSTKRNPNDDNH